MPSQITSTGLEVATATELTTTLVTALQAIYGADINTDPDSPDGQLIGEFVQAVVDVLDLATQVYTGFDPDQAIGVVLDQRVALNGIQRQAGTFTVTNITLVTTQALNIYGLDQTLQPVYTVQDNAGNQWELIATQTLSVGGTYVFQFQAANPGALTTTPNTITSPVTIVLGVASINNPTTYSTLGVNEESDFQLKIRRQQSVSLSSQGYYAGLKAALENINGVTSAFVYENLSGTTDMDGVPGHSIWVIVAGTAPAASIANAIYTKRNAGCGMFGMQSFTITQLDGTFFVVFWDVVTAENLYIQFTATSLDGVTPPNVSGILANLPDIYAPGVNAEVNINQLATLVQEIDPNTLVTNAGFSLSPTGPWTNTLSPSAKNKQFAIASNQIFITPIVVGPSTTTLAPTATQQFVASGGVGTYTWSITINNSGGSIDALTGLYTAGVTAGIDTIQVEDSALNITTATATVT